MINRGIGLVVMLSGCMLLPNAQGQEGDKSSLESVIKQMIDTMDGLTKTLATIRDEESAKSAQPELKKTAEQWRLIKKKAEGVSPPSKEEKDRLAKQFKMKLEEAQKKLFTEVARVSAIQGGREAILEISSVLKKEKKENELKEK